MQTLDQLLNQIAASTISAPATARRIFYQACGLPYGESVACLTAALLGMIHLEGKNAQQRQKLLNEALRFIRAAHKLAAIKTSEYKKMAEEIDQTCHSSPLVDTLGESSMSLTDAAQSAIETALKNIPDAEAIITLTGLLARCYLHACLDRKLNVHAHAFLLGQNLEATIVSMHTSMQIGIIPSKSANPSQN